MERGRKKKKKRKKSGGVGELGEMTTYPLICTPRIKIHLQHLQPYPLFHPLQQRHRRWTARHPPLMAQTLWHEEQLSRPVSGLLCRDLHLAQLPLEASLARSELAQEARRYAR